VLIREYLRSYDEIRAFIKEKEAKDGKMIINSGMDHNDIWIIERKG